MAREDTITKSSGLSLVDFREYNRGELIDWMAAHAYGDSARDGAGIRRIDKRQKPGPGAPLSGGMFRALDDLDIQFTDKTMRRVLNNLERECPLWYVLLTPVYFAAEPSPSKSEEWRRQASGGVSEQYTALYNHYLAAIEWMLDRPRSC